MTEAIALGKTTAATTTTVTDINAVYSVNSYAGSEIFFIAYNKRFIVLSNTVNTITFDGNYLAPIGSMFTVYNNLFLADYYAQLLLSAELNASASAIAAAASAVSIVREGANGVAGLDANLNTIAAPGIQGMAALRLLTPTANRQKYLAFHTTADDGGAGHFRGVTGAAPGTYVDNNGTIIVPTGGDGSSAWVRSVSGLVDIRWFGASPTLTDATNTTAINSALVVGNIFIPEGVFHVLGMITTNGSSMYGTAKSLLFKPFATYSNVYTLTILGSGVRVSGVTFDTDFPSTTASGQTHIQINDMSQPSADQPTLTDIRIDNCKFLNHNFYAIATGQQGIIQYLHIHDNYFNSSITRLGSNNNFALELYPRPLAAQPAAYPGQSWKIYNNTIVGTSIVKVENTVNTIISNNYIYHPTLFSPDGGSGALELNGCLNMLFAGNTYISNVNGSALATSQLAGQMVNSGLTISGNKITGIVVLGVCANVEITNNNIESIYLFSNGTKTNIRVANNPSIGLQSGVSTVPVAINGLYIQDNTMNMFNMYDGTSIVNVTITDFHIKGNNMRVTGGYCRFGCLAIDRLELEDNYIYVTSAGVPLPLYVYGAVTVFNAVGNTFRNVAGTFQAINMVGAVTTMKALNNTILAPLGSLTNAVLAANINNNVV